MTILDGRALAQKILDEIKTELAKLSITPGLGIIFVGDNPSSEHYVELKKHKAETLGFHTQIAKLPATVSQQELEAEISAFNNNPKIHGFIIQLPLPSHLDANAAINKIDPRKDADGLHPINLGRLASGDFGIIPATAAGIVCLIENVGIVISGANAVIIGRSKIVGLPTALLLLHRNATITICHSRTKNLAQYTREADILVAAAGKPKLISADMVKDGACVIDAGNTKIGNKWIGDVDYENVKKRAGWLTPVPGGVGPMTVAMLLKSALGMAKNLPRRRCA